ncbi:MAG: VOC family protein [Pseudomonadota bacterium]
MMEQRVSGITLAVADMEKSAAFYEALGWQRLDNDEEGITVFQLLGQVIGLYPREALARDTGLDITPGFTGLTLGYNVREKEEVAAICAKVKEAGGKVIKEPHDIFWGGHSSYVADLDGHVWEVAWNPFSPPREDGSFHWGG